MNKVIIKARSTGPKNGIGSDTDTYNFIYTLYFLFDDGLSHRVKIKNVNTDVQIYNNIVQNNETIELTDSFIQVVAYTNTDEVYLGFYLDSSIFYNNGQLAKSINIFGTKDGNNLTLYSDILTATTNACTCRNVQLYNGYIVYTTDSTNPKTTTENNTTNEWEENDIKTLQLPYTVKARYLASLNHPHCSSKISVFEKGNLLIPTFTYNSETGIVTLVNNSDGIAQIITKNGYKKNNPYDIKRILDNYTNISTAYDYLAIKGYTYTETQQSDIINFDLSLIGQYNSIIKPIIRVKNNIISFDIDDIITEPGVFAYYTINGDIPTKNSILYTGSFQVNRDVEIIKVIYYIYDIESIVTEQSYTYEENSDIVIEGEPKINKTGGEEINRHKGILKSYIDIIDNKDFENIKVLNFISYILYKINNTYSPINISEELLNRRFAGNKLIIYTDETYSGLLDLNTEDNINEFNNKNKPAWNVGSWNFNYFRNYINKILTENDLKDFCNFKYYNSKTHTLEDATISIEKLRSLYNVNNLNIVKNDSDLKSLIYGKYFILRFIFDNNTNIKFEQVELNKSIEV